MLLIARLLLVTLALCAAVFAEDGYRMPSKPLADLVAAPATPFVSLSPDRQVFALLTRSEVPGIAELAQPEMRLAGRRWNPSTRAISRAVTYTGIKFQDILATGAGALRTVEGIPSGARILHYEWSRDSRHFAFTVERDDRIELWLVAREKAQAACVGSIRLNAVLCNPLSWLDNETMIVACVPEGLGIPPAQSKVPTGPAVQENSEGKSSSRTFQDLLASKHDEDVFEYFCRSEIALVGVDGTVRRIKGPALHTYALPSPDGNYMLVGSLQRPFSYQVPSTRFPVKIGIIDRKGATVREVGFLPLAENMIEDAVRPGPRLLMWRADKPAELSWVESLTKSAAPVARKTEKGAVHSEKKGTEKSAKKNVRVVRDAWYTQAAPFDQKPVLQQRFSYRVEGISWGDDALALVTEEWKTSKTTQTWLVAPGKPGSKPELLWKRSTEDRYADKGRPATVRNSRGRLVLYRSPDGGKIYLYGEGASPEGDRPFLDEMDLATKTTTRLWQSEAPWYEEFFAFTDSSARQFLTRRESVDVPPNYYLRTLGAGAPVALTQFPHPHPQMAGVKKELIKYRRADGVALSGLLYLPAGYTPEQGPLPTLLWAYPREYLTADAAEQIKASPYRFVRVSPTGPLPFLLAGYAVLSDPVMPIIGEKGKEPNDTYVEQLVSSAQAAVDELVRRGVSKPGAIAVGGHSYGAFMTANLLVHTRLFAAGIARSGAYNRTLTPFGFQSEKRTFWKAPDVYGAMSPFNHADKVRDPLLLIHGGADNNPGTFTLQSERLYAAVKGNGGKTRLVILPHESHGYQARESLLHVLWEMENWLDRYVKPGLKR